jgi:hypothetical protein
MTLTSRASGGPGRMGSAGLRAALASCGMELTRDEVVLPWRPTRTRNLPTAVCRWVPPIPRHDTHTLLAQVSELLEQMGDGATVASPAVLDATFADATPRSPTGSPATAASAVPLRQLVPGPAPVPTPERAPGPTLESAPEPASVARPKTSMRSPQPDTAAARQHCRKCKVDFSGAQCPERHAIFMYVAPRNESSLQQARLAPTGPATSELSPSAEYGCAR